MSTSLPLNGLQHTRLPCPSLSPGVCSNSCPLSCWCYITISFSVTSLFLLPSISPSIRVFQWIGSSHQIAKILVLQHGPSNEYSELISFRTDWFDLLVVQGFSKAFSSTTIQKHQFLSTQHSLESNSHIHTWLLEKP